MALHHQKYTRVLFLFSAALLTFMISGCAIGTTRLDVGHDPLTTIENRKQGRILVKQFVDKRKEVNLEEIGNKRNMFGMVLGHVGMQEGVRLDALLTKFFAEALTTAGYSTVVEGAQAASTSAPAGFDAVVTGEIVEFWMDLYLNVWHTIEVNTKALNPTTQAVLWEKNIKDDERNVLWLGVTSEYERVVNSALTKALNQAANAYASDEFYSAIRK